MRASPSRRVWRDLVAATVLGACAASAGDQRDSATATGRVPVQSAIDTASQRFELRTLQGDPLPVTLAQVRDGTQESCGDTTYSAVYAIRGSRWINREVTGDDCGGPAQHHERTDSGTVERWGDSVRFLYPSGGAITGRWWGDSLVVEDGGPREVYVRAHQ